MVDRWALSALYFVCGNIVLMFRDNFIRHEMFTGCLPSLTKKGRNNNYISFHRISNVPKKRAFYIVLYGQVLHACRLVRRQYLLHQNKGNLQLICHWQNDFFLGMIKFIFLRNLRIKQHKIKSYGKVQLHLILINQL